MAITMAILATFIFSIEYRAKHNAGEPRQRKPWFNKKYYASIMKLNDMEGMFYGEEYLGLMADIFKQMFGNKI